MKKHVFLTLGLALLASLSSVAQSNYQPAPENLQARQSFQDAKFGMFIHWGVYSILGDGEWVMNNRNIPIKDYEKLPGAFNPTQFSAQEWVSLAKSTGMKYITITTKHHDGFAMWDSKVSDYNIVARTPYGKDVLKQLADECRKQDIKLFFYHSHIDWHHPDYFPLGISGREIPGRPTSGDFNKYLDYMDAQLTELLTNYGPVAGIWFDGWWDQKLQGRKTAVDWRLDKTYSLIHKLQPACLVGNNHHVETFPGEDFQAFEKDLPGSNAGGFSADSKVSALPLETCDSMSIAWGFNIYERRYKSTKDLVHYLVRAAGNNANFLLNVGPMSNGKIQPEFIKTLHEIGAWMQVNGETIHGTRGVPGADRVWGTMTQKGDKYFVHILNWQDAELTIPALGKKFKSAQMFKDKTAVAIHSAEKETLTLQLPSLDKNALDTVVELTLE